MKQEVKAINKRISIYRKLAGYTQQTAADALGIKKNTYARMELHGNPTPDMLVKLARLYNVSPNSILFGVDRHFLSPHEDGDTDGTRINDNNIFAEKPDLVLTTNEKNCIRACRKLTKEQQKEVMALINKLYKNTKGNA